MEQFVRTVAANPYLQTASIIVALGTAAIFLLNNRKSILSVLKGLWNAFAGKVWIPLEVSRIQIEVGSSNASFLLAVFVRHAVVLTISVFIWSLLGTIIDELRKLENATKLSQTVYISTIILRNVCSLVIGSRLGELYLISNRVIRRGTPPS